jgi:streptomycin 6-kinase
LLPVICEGAAAILKIAAHEEERRGTALLVYYAGAGAVRVLASEGDAILLERAAGRKSLSRMSAEGEDDEATRILCEVAGLLHAPRLAPPPTALVPLDTWFQPLADAAAAYGGAFAAPAATAAELLREPRDPVPLHGDLHHSNVLDGGPRGWLAIDPKALIGERGFDFANLFRNPNFDVARAPGRLRHRAGIVAERAGLDARRLLQWVLAYAGLGAAWSLEDGEDPALNLAIAETAAAELRSTG